MHPTSNPTATMEGAGRICPTHWRYTPADLSRSSLLETEILYVVGGLYGNSEALRTLEERLLGVESGEVRCVFNGDFHWFDVDAARFRVIATGTSRHLVSMGNVEAAFLDEGEGSTNGCGCAYPDTVANEVVVRSNQIHAILAETAKSDTAHLHWLATQPMFRSFLVGNIRVAVVHGDAWSLSGWTFAVDTIDQPASRWRLTQAFSEAKVDVIASSHTCLPVLRVPKIGERRHVLVNNGAAGMPNFRGTHYGLVTRIATRPAPVKPLYGTTIGKEPNLVHVDAMKVPYDHDAWCREFLSQWRAGSPAHVSYLERIMNGPNFDVSVATNGSR